jgi:hypothetical protein
MPPKEKLKPEDLAFNNAAVLAIQKNATERDELRKKNKEERAALYARRRASRNTGGSSRLKGLSVLNDGFAGTSGVS